MLDSLRDEVWQLHLELYRNGLVQWSSGNVSARDAATGLVVIKPSQAPYSQLTPASFLVVDMSGRVVEGDLAPSIDCASHLYVYRHRPNLNGIVHTHSPYATAFAAVGQDIPVVLSAIADVFGGPVPCSKRYAPTGGEEIGEEILRTLGAGPAVLLRQHGVFAVGATPLSALKAAVMIESVAKTVTIARQLGAMEPISPAEIERANKLYASGPREQRRP